MSHAAGNKIPDTLTSFDRHGITCQPEYRSTNRATHAAQCALEAKITLRAQGLRRYGTALV